MDFVKSADGTRFKRLTEKAKVLRIEQVSNTFVWIPMGFIVADVSVGAEAHHYGLRKSFMISTDAGVLQSVCAMQKNDGLDTKKMESIIALMAAPAGGA